MIKYLIFFYNKCEIMQFYIAQCVFIQIIEIIIKFLNHFDYCVIKILDIHKIYFDVNNVKSNKFVIVSNIIYFVLFDRK